MDTHALPAPPGETGHPLRPQLAVAFERTASGDLDGAEDAANGVLAAARASGDAQYEARALRRLAHIAVLRGDYLTSESRLVEALRIARQLQDHPTACLCHYAFSRHLQLAGRLAEAEGALGEALMHAQRTGLKDYEGMVYLEHAVCKQWLGQLEDQLVYAETALELLREAGDQEMLFFTLTLAADAADHLGKSRLAGLLLEEARSMTGISGYANVMCGTLAEAALRRLSAGEVTLAAEHLAAAEAHFSANCDFDTEILLRVARGRLLSHGGQHELAALEFRDAKRLAQQHQSRCHIALVRLERAPGQIALGRFEQAQATLTDAEMTFELIGAQLNLARTFCAWTHYHVACGHRQAALAALQKAQALAMRHEPACGLHLGADLRGAQAALLQ